ncbi:MAG: hypothetical protein ACYTKD_29165 [Planctomycetota bacterium]|jgi:hypothetical protein
MKPITEKVHWQGTITSVQPRIRLMRSFDERQHSYLGYVLRVSGHIGEEEREFTVAIGKGAQQKHAFRMGDQVQGQSVPVADPRVEPAEVYKTSGLKVVERPETPEATGAPPPPYLGIPPALEIYRARGHRRLSARTYTSRCTVCMWGCRMPVEIIIDHWDPSRKTCRFETFCYGPKSCPSYKAGPPRSVQGRKKGMVYVEEDWVDEDATSHRGPDE